MYVCGVVINKAAWNKMIRNTTLQERITAKGIIMQNRFRGSIMQRTNLNNAEVSIDAIGFVITVKTRFDRYTKYLNFRRNANLFN